ncbi:MAG: FtsQ-type POTRA domain-containing protein [Acidobacteria bacterium]|nr:FtsQ-type POTRA domain-containing protein [Acidobacteriota bacterium]
MATKSNNPFEDVIPDTDAPESSSESTPRRRNTAVLRGARITRRAHMIRSAITLAMALAIVGAAAWLLANYFKSNSRYRLATIELRGEKHLGRSEVNEVFRADQGHSIYDIPLDERRRQIEEISLVHHASVTRVLPGEIWVRVEERQPVAFLWSPKGVSLIDAEGVVLDAPPETLLSLPVLRGVTLDEPEPNRREKLQRLVQFSAAIENSGRTAVEQISEVNLADPRNLRAIATDGDHSVLLHFGEESYAERFQTYLTHIDDWRQQFTEIQSIDLRYEGQAVIHSGEPQTVRIDKPTQSPRPLKPPSPPATRAAGSPTPSAPMQEAGMAPVIGQ